MPISRRNRSIDVIAVGELLIDFLSTDFADSLLDISSFKRVQGGSPANLGLNMHRLGNQVHLVASVGQDAMGDYLVQNVEATGLNTNGIRRSAEPTTLILVTRSKEVSSFEAYRGADCRIKENQLNDVVLQQASLFHTTCFALSQDPAQSVILGAAHRAAEFGCQLSIDANYASKIWPDRSRAQEIVRQFSKLGSFIKISEVDWERLYRSPLATPEVAAEHFLNLGAKQVCVTLGEAGLVIGSAETGIQHIPVTPVEEVKDTTGAGDAFWSGYLTGWLDGYSPKDCARAGAKMAAIKLQHFGPLTAAVDRARIY